ncbi:hypothetical protein SteCoe_7169 [Stentor coeruleus]|uniref:C3H1-type domain-containing protein n=1 Tax=Stentor coeruleus TaxID=5963 RepID=A0A1R2CN72_9CILI|nr:hypothetical protein SteCoe_7169 [Stentor coeruleus]
MENLTRVYKTKQCNNMIRMGSCLQRNTCNYYHDETDRRRLLNFGYDGILCLEAVINDFCSDQNCKFCKNYIEFFYHPQNFKALECMYKKANLDCNNLMICPFYHSPEEKIQYYMQRENNKENAGFESENEIKPIEINERRPELARIPSERTYYVLKEELKKYEDRKTEFKSSKNIFRIQNSADIIAPYVSAFLNTEGGILFYGIKDNGVVEGISLSRKDRDQFTLALDNIFQKFNPQITHEDYQITFKQVKDKNYKDINDLYVIEFRVNKGKKDSVYFTHKNETYIRRDASVSLLKGHDLLEFYTKKQSSLVI